MSSHDDRRSRERRGPVNRREFLAAVAAAGVSSVTAARGLSSVALPRQRLLGRARLLSHVGVSVSDMTRSARFYQALFGFPPLKSTTPPRARTYGFYFHGHFISLNPAPREQAGRITHYCLGLEDFDPERDGAKMKAAGFEGVSIDVEGADRWVLVPDPDRNVVQIFDRHYLAKCPTCDEPPAGSSMPPPPNPVFRPRTLQHVGLTVADLRRATAFYQKLFDLRDPRPLASPGAPEYALDFNGYFLSLSTPGPQGKPGVITHYGVGVDEFDAPHDAETLRAAGFQDVQVRPNGIDCLIVRDPDGVPIRISRTDYIYPCQGCADPPP